MRKYKIPRLGNITRHLDDEEIGLRIVVLKDNVDIFETYMKNHQHLSYRTTGVIYDDGYRMPTRFTYLVKGLFELEDILAFKLSVPCADDE